MQRNLKRLMGLSGVAHAVFLLLGVIAVFKVPWAASALFFYLWTYLFASYAVFTIMVYRGGGKRRNPHIGRLSRTRQTVSCSGRCADISAWIAGRNSAARGIYG